MAGIAVRKGQTATIAVGDRRDRRDTEPQSLWITNQIGEACPCRRFAPPSLPRWFSSRRSAPGAPTSSCGGSRVSNPEEDAAVREIIAAFEQKTGKQVELDQPSQDDIETKVVAGGFGRAAARFPVRHECRRRLRPMGRRGPAGRPLGRDRAVRKPVRPGRARLRHAARRDHGQTRPVRAADRAFSTHHVHVWRNLLEQAGFTLDDIPKQWEAFWSFWCDQVQPAVRKARAATTSGASAWPCRPRRHDTRNRFFQFMHAYEANYVTREGKLVIDDPEIRRRLIKAHGQLHRHLPQGLHPARRRWDGTIFGNNQAFLDQSVVMTAEPRRSRSRTRSSRAPRRLLQEHRDDRMAGRSPPARPLADRARHLPGRGLQGRRASLPPPRSSCAFS